MNYERTYHSEVHDYLLNNKKYYNLRAKLAKEKYFKNIPENKKIIEFGCGLGQNIYYLKNAEGYDISKFSLEFCKKKGIKTVDKISKLRKNYYDIVFSAHVLEHLDSPKEYIKIIKDILKKNGKLILVLPVERQKKVNFKAIDANQHLFSWTFRTINNLLIKSGFKIKENKSIYGTGFMKLKLISNLGLKPYSFATQLFGRILRRQEMIIIAEKC